MHFPTFVALDKNGKPLAKCRKKTTPNPEIDMRLFQAANFSWSSLNFIEGKTEMKAILALEDGSVFHGEGFGAKRVGLRRGVLQHLDDRLSGNPHRPVLQRPDRHDDLSAHRQLRRERRGRRILAAARRRLRDPRAVAGRQQLARGFFARGISGEKWDSRNPGD